MALMVTSFPMTISAIHILNQSWVFDAMFAVFKPFLDARMLSKIFFHGEDMKSLHRHIAPTHLPKKYGGTRNEVPYYKWIDSLSSSAQVIKEMKSVGYLLPENLLQLITE